MARVEFSLSTVQRHGFPYTCILCGNDDQPSLVKHKLSALPSRPAVGCLLLALGPFGWMLALYLAFRTRREANLPAPVCALCHEAKERINLRTCLAVAVCGAALIGSLALAPSRLYMVLVPTAALAGLWAVVEHCTLGSQFRLHCRSIEGDQIVVDVPNEEFPATYQRHLDTVLLYGGTNSAGIAE